MSGTGKEKAEKAGNKVAAAPEKRPDGAEAMAAANFDVEQLVALRHDRKGRVEFLVRWKTYDASHDTWVSNASRHPPPLRSLSAVDLSLRLIGHSLPPSCLVGLSARRNRWRT